MLTIRDTLAKSLINSVPLVFTYGIDVLASLHSLINISYNVSPRRKIQAVVHLYRMEYGVVYLVKVVNLLVK